MPDLGKGVIRPEGVWYRDNDLDAEWLSFSSTGELLPLLSRRFGAFVLDVEEALRGETQRFTVYQRPF